jgi:hypothetical protein
MLHSDLFPEFGCDGELIEMPAPREREDDNGLLHQDGNG